MWLKKGKYSYFRYQESSEWSRVLRPSRPTAVCCCSHKCSDASPSIQHRSLGTFTSSHRLRRTALFPFPLPRTDKALKIFLEKHQSPPANFGKEAPTPHLPLLPLQFDTRGVSSLPSRTSIQTQNHYPITAPSAPSKMQVTVAQPGNVFILP